MLIDKEDGNVFSLGGVEVKSSLDRGIIGLLVDNEEVLGGVGRGRNVLNSVSISMEAVSRSLGIDVHTPTPARRRPVTESCDKVLVGSEHSPGSMSILPRPQLQRGTVCLCRRLAVTFCRAVRNQMVGGQEDAGALGA
jgi:hypothetical protein